MCKDRTTKWGYSKTIKKREYEAIIDETSARGPDGKIWIRGKQIKQRDVNRYLKRRKVNSSPLQRQLRPAAGGMPSTEIISSPNPDAVRKTLGRDKACEVLVNNSKVPSGDGTSDESAARAPCSYSAVFGHAEES